LVILVKILNAFVPTLQYFCFQMWRIVIWIPVKQTNYNYINKAKFYINQCKNINISFFFFFTSYLISRHLAKFFQEYFLSTAYRRHIVAFGVRSGKPKTAINLSHIPIWLASKYWPLVKYLYLSFWSINDVLNIITYAIISWFLLDNN